MFLPQMAQGKKECDNESDCLNMYIKEIKYAWRDRIWIWSDIEIVMITIGQLYTDDETVEKGKHKLHNNEKQIQYINQAFVF